MEIDASLVGGAKRDGRWLRSPPSWVARLARITAASGEPGPFIYAVRKKWIEKLPPAW